MNMSMAQSHLDNLRRASGGEGDPVHRINPFEDLKYLDQSLLRAAQMNKLMDEKIKNKNESKEEATAQQIIPDTEQNSQLIEDNQDDDNNDISILRKRRLQHFNSKEKL